jgi:hypothetical protein
LLTGLIVLGVPIVDVASFFVAFAALVLLVTLIPSGWRSSRTDGGAGGAPVEAAPKPPELVAPPTSDGGFGRRS